MAGATSLIGTESAFESDMRDFDDQTPPEVSEGIHPIPSRIWCWRVGTQARARELPV